MTPIRHFVNKLRHHRRFTPSEWEVLFTNSPVITGQPYVEYDMAPQRWEWPEGFLTKRLREIRHREWERINK